MTSRRLGPTWRTVARRLGSEVERRLVRYGTRSRRADRFWLAAARDPARSRLRRRLAGAGVLPDVVTVPLDPLGFPDRHVRMRTGSPHDQVAVVLWIDGARAYEPPVAQLVAALGRRSRRTVVVGANTGFYCLVVAMQPGVRVDAVEPWPPAIERLRENLALNRLDGEVVVWESAAGSKTGSSPLFVPPALHDAWPFEMSASLAPDYRRSHDHVVDVPVTTVDTIRDEVAMPVDLLLVDAEGFDAEVLHGARATITSDGPIVVSEVTSDEVPAMNALLGELGLMTVEIAPTGVWIRERMVRPVHIAGRVLDSATAAECWISAVLPPNRLPDLVAAASECSLPVFGGEDRRPR